ncbi:MAG: DUF4956 domain-containing protein [Anaerolineae bacterium]|nr:DUF4956 domain-containing protein [Anaerolineae bacterium]
MDQWFATSTTGIVTFAANMLLGLLLSVLVAWYYQAYGHVLGNRRKLATLMPVLTLTTGMVISVVKSSLALSLGLVGALSIVRFRTAIKEPEELLFLFIAIAIGLGTGAEQRWITLVGVILVLGYMSVRMVLGRRTQDHNLYLNIMVEDGEAGLFTRVNSCLLKYVDVVDFRRLDSRDGMMQLTYFIACDDAQMVNDLVDDLKATLPVSEISFLQQEQLLGG